MKKSIAVLFGGDSEEWEISEKSALTVFNNLDRVKYEPFLVRIRENKWEVIENEISIANIDRNDFSFHHKNEKVVFDFAFIEIHGTPGENGILQGYFDLLQLPYSTCGQLASAITFNKSTCTALLKQYGFNVAHSVVLRDKTKIDTVSNSFNLPCFVKPNNGGSSFGISKVNKREQLKPAIEKAFQFDNEVMVEEMMEGREVTNGAFRFDKKIVPMSVTEIVSSNDFFDYEAKYEGAAQEITPAPVTASIQEKIQQTTINIYEALNLKGLIRIDYILEGDELKVIEVNTTPGLSEESLIPQQAKDMKLSLSDLFDMVIQDSLT